MNIKFDFPKIESYSLVLSEKLCSEFYQSRNLITGKQLLEFCSIEQVNFFVLMNLLDKWNEESEKVKSPYFDYESPQVKASLKEFMNVLSQNIAIRKEFFKPLLQKSITDTLIYALDPVYYIKALVNANEHLQFTVLKEKAKYIRLNKNFYQAVVKELEGLGEQSGESAISRIEQFADSNQSLIESGASVIEKFSILSKVEIADITLQPISLKEKDEVTFSVPETNTTVSFFESLTSETPKEEFVNPAPEKEEILKEETIKAELPKVAEVLRADVVKVESPKAEPLNAEQERRVIVQSQTSERNTYSPSAPTLNASFEKKQMTLNELLKQADKPTIAEQLAKSKIVSIKSAISLNQKFIFINTLFMGEAKEFDAALTEVDNCLSLDSAKNVLDSKYITKFKWDMSSAEVKEFMDIVSRKFA